MSRFFVEKVRSRWFVLDHEGFFVKDDHSCKLAFKTKREARFAAAMLTIAQWEL